MRHIRIGLAVLVLAAMTAAIAVSAPVVQQMLPAANSVKGFSIMKDSLVYGKGDDIAKIYNGGYELYTKNGVIDAVRQMYMRKNDYAEVTVHTMKSNKAALDFLKYWQKELKAPKLTTTKTSTSFSVTKPNVMVYSVTGQYLTTVSMFYDSSSASADAKAMASVVEKNVINSTKSKKDK